MSNKYLFKPNNPNKRIIYCKHNNIKNDCYECYKSFFCIHNINKKYCKKCDFRKQSIKKEKKLTEYNIFVKNNMHIVKTLYPDTKQKEHLVIIGKLWNSNKKDVYIDKDMNISTNIDPTINTDSIDPINPIESINPIKFIDPINSIDSSINTNFIDPIDSIDSSINTNFIDSIDSIDPCINTTSIDPIESIDSIFSVIPTFINDDIQYNLIDNIDLNEYYLKL